MGTMAQQELVHGVDELLADPQWGKMLNDVKKKLQSGHFSGETPDFVFQYSRKSIDIYDAYVYAQSHAAVGAGKIARVKIHVGSTPSGDAALEENNAKLTNLPYPFSADFFGGAGGTDGYLKWTDDIRLEIGIAGHSNHGHQVYAKGAFPSQAQLEVGLQYASKTLFQFTQLRCLARWPYGHEWIYLYVVKDKTLWTVPSLPVPWLDDDDEPIETAESEDDDCPEQPPPF